MSQTCKSNINALCQLETNEHKGEDYLMVQYDCKPETTPTCVRSPFRHWFAGKRSVLLWPNQISAPQIKNGWPTHPGHHTAWSQNKHHSRETRITCFSKQLQERSQLSLESRQDASSLHCHHPLSFIQPESSLLWLESIPSWFILSEDKEYRSPPSSTNNLSYPYDCIMPNSRLFLDELSLVL